MKEFVIDKNYVFYAIGGGLIDEVPLHMQCGHDEVMAYGDYFSNNDFDEHEIAPHLAIKDMLDETLAKSFADTLFLQWREEHQGREHERSIEDYIDSGWETVSELIMDTPGAQNSLRIVRSTLMRISFSSWYVFCPLEANYECFSNIRPK